MADQKEKKDKKKIGPIGELSSAIGLDVRELYLID